MADYTTDVNVWGSLNPFNAGSIWRSSPATDSDVTRNSTVWDMLHAAVAPTFGMNPLSNSQLAALGQEAADGQAQAGGTVAQQEAARREVLDFAAKTGGNNDWSSAMPDLGLSNFSLDSALPDFSTVFPLIVAVVGVGVALLVAVEVINK